MRMRLCTRQIPHDRLRSTAVRKFFLLLFLAGNCNIATTGQIRRILVLKYERMIRFLSWLRRGAALRKMESVSLRIISAIAISLSSLPRYCTPGDHASEWREQSQAKRQRSVSFPL
jgi:hypothetical protein